MAIYHRATVTPTKLDMIARWAPTRPWGPPSDSTIELIGSYRFDDPEGAVGMESHLVVADGTIFHVPLTYRDAPLDGRDDVLIDTTEHSVLGTRWVYDGLADPLFVVMLAAVTMTGQGEALGMVVYDGRWFVAPSAVRIEGGGWSEERVPVDGFALDDVDGSPAVLRNDRFTLTVHRRPEPGPRPDLGLLASWPARPDGVVVAEVTDRGV